MSAEIRENQEIRVRHSSYAHQGMGSGHHRPSRLDTLTKNQKLDIRAHQRTYQGAYIRTCINCLSFSLLVMKLFSREFMSIGIVFQVYSLLLCVIGYSRASNMDLYFIDFSDSKWYEGCINKDQGEPQVSTYDGHVNIDNKYYFKTSGNYVLWLSLITGGCYVVLFVLLAIM